MIFQCNKHKQRNAFGNPKAFATEGGIKNHMKNKIKDRLRYFYTFLTFLFTNMIFKLTVFATEATKPSDADKVIKETYDIPTSPDGGAADELKNFLVGDNGFMNFVSQAGWILIAFGLGQLIMAFKDDNLEAKSRGTMILLGGVFCVSISGILKKLGADI